MRKSRCSGGGRSADRALSVVINSEFVSIVHTYRHISQLTSPSRGSYDTPVMAALQLIAVCAIACFGTAAIMRGASFMTLAVVMLLAVWIGFIMRSFYGY